MPRFRRRLVADHQGKSAHRGSRSTRGHYGLEGVAALRRLITLVTVLAAALLGGVAATAPAQAKAPGANGQIVFGRYSTALGDFQIFTANPDGTNEAQVLPGAAGRPAPGDEHRHVGTRCCCQVPTAPFRHVDGLTVHCRVVIVAR